MKAMMARLLVTAVATAMGGLPALAADGERAFRSPTGNIHCLMENTTDAHGVRCDLVEATVSYRKRPADCDLDYGKAFYLDALGRGEVACHGDTIIDPRAPVLDYGRSIEMGRVRCTSERSGMTCRNDIGHGFTIARAKQHVF